MTYIYRFTINETGQCYVGQHRTIKSNDPYKDNYKGSGTQWIELLKNNNLWELDNFRKGVSKEIINVWYGDVSRFAVGEAEKKAIEKYKKLYGELCLNVNCGSFPSWIYDDEATLKKTSKEKYKQNLIRNYLNNLENCTCTRKVYSKVWIYINRHRFINPKNISFPKDWGISEKKEYKRQYLIYSIKNKKICDRKVYLKINRYIHRNNYPSPEVAIFPKSWGTVEIAEYKRQWENRK